MKDNTIIDLMIPLMWIVVLALVNHFSGIETVIILGMALLLSEFTKSEEK